MSGTLNPPLWRIASETTTYKANDLSGTGAKITGGRWNPVGVPMVYCSTSIALAVLETVCHIDGGVLPLNRYLVRIDVPATVWDAAQTLSPLPDGWDARPADTVTMEAGSEWVAHGRSALLLVPSVIVQEEMNALINPVHAQSTLIKATKVRKWTYDARLLLR